MNILDFFSRLYEQTSIEIGSWRKHPSALDCRKDFLDLPGENNETF